VIKAPPFISITTQYKYDIGYGEKFREDYVDADRLSFRIIMSLGDVAIAGFGDSYAHEDNQKSAIQLATEATTAAVKDANISHDDIDAVITGRPPLSDQRPQWNNVFSSYLNIPTKYSTEVTNHGAGVNGTIKHALSALNSDFVDTVLCVSSDAASLFSNPVEEIPQMDADREFEYPYGPFMPSLYGMVAERYMHEYDITHEQMAHIAVTSRRWAIEHPHAEMNEKGKITIDDVINSKEVSSPLNLLDCAPYGPGGTGGALIITKADRAENLQEKPIYIRGVGEYNTHEKLTDRLALRGKKPNETRPNLTTTGAKEAARQAYTMADLTPEDMDLVEPSTNFTHIGLMLLEDLGFCEKGEGGKFVENGGIDFDNGIPFNTNGGWLSFGQPVISGPMDMIVEAIRQMRNSALGKQVSDPNTALTHGIGGPTACHSVSILSTRRGSL
jgi:acetyl-CoA acetyltransferase